MHDEKPYVDEDSWVLVLPDRDAAEAVSDELGQRYPDLPEPELHREALAGEDDAEDAQWLLVLQAPVPDGLNRAALSTLAAEYDGWLE
ncbi:histidinol dehydrogenase [Streptacidiphilus sp. 4-A2]|nr:histidinol dehydrogenase [Streptacidiphilus sp. 4-A2]